MSNDETTETINIGVDADGRAIAMTFPANVDEAIEAALTSGDGDRQLEAIVARAVQEEGFRVIRFNAQFYRINPVTGGKTPIGEIDIEIAEAIIEVTTTAKSKAGQVRRFLTDPSLNAASKPVILYAPNLSAGAARAVSAVGGIVVLNRADFKKQLQRLRKT